MALCTSWQSRSLAMTKVSDRKVLQRITRGHPAARIEPALHRVHMAEEELSDTAETAFEQFRTLSLLHYRCSTT